MERLKEVAIQTIQKMPEECSMEDIMYELNFVAQVMEGLQDADAGNLMTTDELLQRVETWGEASGGLGA